MSLLLTVLLVSIIPFHYVATVHRNSFDVVRGCKQYDSVGGYDQPVTYIPTNNMMHVGHSSNSQYFRIGILGPQDGHIRYGRTLYPYDKDVIEIVLAGWMNTKSVARRQHRKASNENMNLQLAEAQTPQLLSPYRPVMFLLEIFNNGTVQVSLDGPGHRSPFLTFQDSSLTPPNFMAFIKWQHHVLVYFYDCPLEHGENAMDDTLLLNCTLVEH